MEVLAIWGFFAGLVVGTLMVGILRHMNKPQPLSLREAAAWTGTWVGLAALFGVAVLAYNGMDRGMEFINGYITEWSLSVGILFVFLMIFQSFAVPEQYRQRVLFWGIVGAIVLRGTFLVGAVDVLSNVSWLVYVFGAFLTYTGIKLLRQGAVHVERQKNPVPRSFQGVKPVRTSPESRNFFVRRKGKQVATALMPVLFGVAATDIIFTAYSIPAILAITQDPFIVYTANLYAILGLRALFFLLAGIMGLFRFLQVGLCVALMFAGVKMLISGFVHLPIAILIGVVAVVLAGSIVASILLPAAKGMVPERGEEGLAETTGSAGKERGEDEEEYRRAA